MIQLDKLVGKKVSVRCGDGDGTTGSGLVQGKLEGIEHTSPMKGFVLLIRKTTLHHSGEGAIVMVPWGAVQYISMAEADFEDAKS